MRKTKRLDFLIRVAGFLIVILGAIHCGATPLVLNEGFKQLPKDLELVFVYMFLATGIAVIGSGLLIAAASSGIARSEHLAMQAAIGSAFFMTLLGITAPLFMPTNPFAYLTIVLAVFLDVLLVLRRQAHKQPSVIIN